MFRQVRCPIESARHRLIKLGHVLRNYSLGDGDLLAAHDPHQPPTPAQRHFNALKRILDRNEPDYAT